MIPLLVLLLVGGGVEGQRQMRYMRQGFRPRGFVPQPGRYVPGPPHPPQHIAPRGQEATPRPRQEPEQTRWSEQIVEQPQVKDVGQRWTEPEKPREAVHTRWTQQVRDPARSRRQKTWEETTTPKPDDEQWFQETHERPVRYPTHKAQQSFNKPFTTPIPILRLDKEQSLDGSYKTSYETGNSIVHEEQGFMKQSEGPEDMLVQQGSYSYKDDEGNVFTVRYTADDQGFRAHGDHFPTPPPVPPEIQRGLEIIYEQIRIDNERRLAEKRYEDDEGNSLEGQYSSNVEQRTPYTSSNNGNEHHPSGVEPRAPYRSANSFTEHYNSNEQRVPFGSANNQEGQYTSNVEQRAPYASPNNLEAEYNSNAEKQRTQQHTGYSSANYDHKSNLRSNFAKSEQLYFNKNKVQPDPPGYNRYSIPNQDSSREPKTTSQLDSTGKYQQDHQLNLGEVVNFYNEQSPNDYDDHYHSR